MNLALVVLYVQFTKSAAAVRAQQQQQQLEAAGGVGGGGGGGAAAGEADASGSGGGSSSGGRGRGKRRRRSEERRPGDSSDSEEGGDGEEEDDEDDAEEDDDEDVLGPVAAEEEEAVRRRAAVEGQAASGKPSLLDDTPLTPTTPSELAGPGSASAAASRRLLTPPSLWRRARRRLTWLARSPGLYGCTVAAILINTLVMCINWYGIPASLEAGLHNVNLCLTAYFTLELLVMVGSMGPKRYFSDGMNVFDFTVVVASIVEAVATLVPSMAGVGPLSVLRCLRFLRLVRLVSRWTELRRVVHTLFKSVLSVAWMSALLMLFLVIAALLGMQVFGYRYQFCDYVAGAEAICPLGQRLWGGGEGACPDHFLCYLPCRPTDVGSWLVVPGSKFFDQAYCQAFCEDGSMTSGVGTAAGGLAAAAGANATAAAAAAAAGRCEFLAVVGKSEVSVSTFDNFGWALLTVFQIVTSENWNNVMYDGMRSSGEAASLYFVFVIVIGNYVTLNLFIAILLENFAANMSDIAETEAELEERIGAKALKRSASFEDADRIWYKQTLGASQVHPAAAAGAASAVDGVPSGPGRPGGGVAAEVAAAEELLEAVQKSGETNGRDDISLGGEDKERRLHQEAGMPMPHPPLRATLGT
ncbi:hypothetical protein GPECTOR_28g776 [Gonium pectorale]|uniref:Ion transport domain-containing protein n=1 Tax=Gonium pectorale TaxID=33097 RepID=A0A150GEU5_GONPE|nr:hypothetical protein GPECTOR_28g776 [Gonium pectorale]|eukprot:KXZ48369.1 hypothetical protein GPECTOR_28g776 [Gonium pectorale]